MLEREEENKERARQSLITEDGGGQPNTLTLTLKIMGSHWRT